MPASADGEIAVNRLWPVLLPELRQFPATDQDTALGGLRTVSAAQSTSPSTPVEDRLSAREREVMGLMVKGLHNRLIAEQLGISPRTVEVHKARVMEKLGVANLVDLVRLADRQQI